MSEVHVYGVIGAADEPVVAQDDVRQVTHGQVAALVSDIARDGLVAARVLRTHWRVLEEAGSRTTVLPVRFGTVMADDRAVVEQFLEPSHDDLVAALADLEGKAQLTLKGTYDEEALMAGIATGSRPVARLREELQGLPEAATYYKRIELGQLVAAAVDAVRERDTQTCVARLEPLAVAVRAEAAATPNAAFNLAFLVELDGVKKFSDAVATLRREFDGRIELRYVGPSPPYSFTDDRVGPGAAAWA
jgi:hypothetical protein